MRLLTALWLAMGSAAFIAGGTAGGSGFLLLFVFIWLPVLIASERSSVQVMREGLRVVPSFGRSRTYPWPEVYGFAVGRWYQVRSVDLVVVNALVYEHGGTKSIRLSATARPPRQRATVERICGELTGELHRGGSTRGTE